MMSMMLILTGCPPDPEIPVTTIEKPIYQYTTLIFRAINNNIISNGKAIEAKSPGAGGGEVNFTLNITVNGHTTTTVTLTNTTQLPVVGGNEIEIIFKPSCPEETEANFTLPDGKSQKVTAESPSFKWVVPDNFKSGDQIIGESEYETEKSLIKQHGEITLIAIE